MIIVSKKGIPESSGRGYPSFVMGNTLQIRPMAAVQWRRSAVHIAAISELGVRFSHQWASSLLTPYIKKRFALEAACLVAAEDEEEFRFDDVWAKLFSAAPKGHRFTLDAGAVSSIARLYEKWAHLSLEPLVDHRRKTAHEAPAIVAAEAAYEWAAKGRAVQDAPARAAVALIEQGIWPADGPLPWWPLPRSRSDGDWLIGALSRLRKALDRSLTLLETADRFERSWRERLMPSLREDASAYSVLAMAAGSPAVTQGDVVDGFSLSKKAAQKAISTLEEAGALFEITGRDDWRVWLANDLMLSPTLDQPGYDVSCRLRSNPFVSPAKRLNVTKPDALDTAQIDADLKDAMDDADDASRRLRETAAKMRA